MRKKLLLLIDNPTTTIINEEQNIHPLNFRVYQNYPNPFNPQTTISYQLYRPANVKIDIYNINGRHVHNLVKGFQNNGYYRFLWDGKNSSGKSVTSGTYLCNFRINDVQHTIRIQLLK